MGVSPTAAADDVMPLLVDADRDTVFDGVVSSVVHIIHTDELGRRCYITGRINNYCVNKSAKLLGLHVNDMNDL